MTRLLKKLVLFCVPFLLYGGVVLVVDPYDFFGISDAVPRELKEKTAARINSTLWEVPAYLNRPTPGILLGDSRMMAVPESLVTEATGIPHTNLAYGGGTLREAIDTFWLAQEHAPLQQVTMGINFNLYSANNSRNRVLEVTSALDNPLLYFTNLNVIHATRLILQSLVGSREPVVGTPPMSPEAFWDRQLNVTTRLFYENYRHGDAFAGELREVADHCRTHGVDLTFVIFPGHTDLQNQVAVYGLEPEYRSFKQELAGIAPVFDFDYENAFTKDRTRFKDPYHVTPEAEGEILRGVWGSGSSFVRRLEKP